MTKQIFEHNESFEYVETPITITNVLETEHRAQGWILGFDNVAHPVNFLLCSGSFPKMVITREIAKKAELNINKNGRVSFLFVIKKNNREFIGSAGTNNEKVCELGVVDTIKSFQDSNGKKYPIDMQVGYEVMKEMANYGFYPLIDDLLPIERPTFLPMSNLGVFGKISVKINNIELLSFHICTTNANDFDVILSKRWVDEHRAEVKHVIPFCYDIFSQTYEGTIDNLTLQFGVHTISLQNLTFCAVDNKTDPVGRIVNCIPGTRFIKKLAEKGFFVNAI